MLGLELSVIFMSEACWMLFVSLRVKPRHHPHLMLHSIFFSQPKSFHPADTLFLIDTIFSIESSSVEPEAIILQVKVQQSVPMLPLSIISLSSTSQIAIFAHLTSLKNPKGVVYCFIFTIKPWISLSLLLVFLVELHYMEGCCHVSISSVWNNSHLETSPGCRLALGPRGKLCKAFNRISQAHSQ